MIDEYTRVALESHIARSIGAREVQRHLANLFEQHGKPVIIRADNGREFIADVLLTWLDSQQVRGIFVAKASPQQNCYIERFNGSMEREVFKHELFHSVLETQVVVDEWLVLYNTRRAHRGLGGKTPAAYAKMARSHMDEDRCGGGR